MVLQCQANVSKIVTLLGVDYDIMSEHYLDINQQNKLKFLQALRKIKEALREWQSVKCKLYSCVHLLTCACATLTFYGARVDSLIRGLSKRAKNIRVLIFSGSSCTIGFSR